MKNLPLKLLLTSLALVCGIHCQTQPHCNPMKRMKTVPSYKTITGKPKKVIDSSGPVGICVAESGIFAVLPYNSQLYFHMYYESGELMKAVRGPHAEPLGLGYCTFSGDYLFLTDIDYHLYKYSINGTYIKLFTRGQYITSCGDRLFVNYGQHFISYLNYDPLEQFNVKLPMHPREMIIDHDSYVRFITSDLLYTYTLFGQQLGVNKYETLGGGNGLAMDLAGNYLIVDRDLPGVRVYSPCGDLITIIQYEEFKLIVDVEIGNDGTIIVTDVENDKIYMF